VSRPGDTAGALEPHEERSPSYSNGSGRPGPARTASGAGRAETGAELVRLAREQVGVSKAILGELRGIREVLANAFAPATRAPSSQGQSAGRGKGGEVASDRDLDSAYGNPTVKTPRNWKGERFDGFKMSETSVEFLEFFADFKDWQADRREEEGGEDGSKKAGYCRKDAARARGWAERLRRGGARPASATTSQVVGGAPTGGGLDPS